MPIILCNGLKATTWEGVSLSTVPFSFVSVEPNIPEVKNLREWLMNHTTDVNKAGDKPKSTYLEAAIKDSKPIQLTKLKDVTPDTQAAHTKVTMRITDIQQRIPYTSCPKCNKTQKARINESFHCHTCKENHVAAPRSKVVVNLGDDSCDISATAFEKNADKILGYTAAEIHAMDAEAIARHLKEIDSILSGKQFTALIRGSKKRFDDKKTRYTLQEWIEYNEANTVAHSESYPGQSSAGSTVELTTLHAPDQLPSSKTNAEAITIGSDA